MTRREGITMAVELANNDGKTRVNMGRKVTKSIRITTDEAIALSRLSGLLSRSSEAALLYEAYSRGLAAIKLDEAVSEYTKREMSLGEVADLFELSSADLARELARRNIPMLEVSSEQAEENLNRLIERHFP
jgi:predicted HTH domain antitoxin